MSLIPTRSIAHPREIFKPVTTHSAYSFIMVHNHPSGAEPRLTRRINEASRILQLNLIDHVIIGLTRSGREQLFQFQRGRRHSMTPFYRAGAGLMSLAQRTQRKTTRFKRYPRREAYEVTPRKLAARRAV